MTVIFDEFQNFNYMYREAYSILQKQFDTQKHQSFLLLIFSGSSLSLMEKIFKGNKEPLFGRSSEFIELSNLSIASQAQFMEDEGIFSQFFTIG